MYWNFRKKWLWKIYAKQDISDNDINQIFLIFPASVLLSDFFPFLHTKSANYQKQIDSPSEDFLVEHIQYSGKIALEIVINFVPDKKIFQN